MHKLQLWKAYAICGATKQIIHLIHRLVGAGGAGPAVATVVTPPDVSVSDWLSGPLYTLRKKFGYIPQPNSVALYILLSASHQVSHDHRW